MTSMLNNFLYSLLYVQGGYTGQLLAADAVTGLQEGTIILAIIMLISTIALSIYIYDKANPGLLDAKKLGIKTFFGRITGGKVAIDFDRFDKEINSAGYAYDEKQDIFYSTHDAWQRKYGYCRLYDELAGPIGGLVFDSEPIHFQYAGKRWLIEFWKGQYGMNFGGEIGVYNTTGPDLNIPDMFNGTFYESISDAEMLHMAFILRKNGRMIFAREDTHWWLTGFKLGEFSEPSELSMEIRIKFDDEKMLREFVNGLYNIGYTDSDVDITKDNVISFVYDKPKTTQPITREAAAEWLIQRKNEQLCTLYRDVTVPYSSLPEKLDAVSKNAPALYKNMTAMGKTKSIYKDEKKMRKYLNK